MTMKKIVMALAVIGCLALVAGPAQATLMALSVNFTNGSYLIGASNDAGVNDYTNWNNMISGTDYLTGGLKLSDGSAATGVKITGFHNFTIDTAPAPVAGSAGDVALMSRGLYMSYSSNLTTGVYTNVIPNFRIEGLLNVFKNGYRLVNYIEGRSPAPVTQPRGGMYASPNAADWNLNTVNVPQAQVGQFKTPGTTYLTANPPVLITPTPPALPYLQEVGWGSNNSNAFNDNFARDEHISGETRLDNSIPPLPIPTVFNAPNGGVGQDMLIITTQPNWVLGSLGELGIGLWAGVQIIGDVQEPIAEPAALGVIGVALLGVAVYRRRK